MTVSEVSSVEVLQQTTDALIKKGATGPCNRCGNNSFLVYEYPSAMYTVFCDNCGLKYEHLGVILLDPSTTNTKVKGAHDGRE